MEDSATAWRMVSVDGIKQVVRRSSTSLVGLGDYRDFGAWYSEDNGATWRHALYWNSDHGIEDPSNAVMWFVRSDLGYVMFGSGAVFRTTDGRNWGPYKPTYRDRYGRTAKRLPVPFGIASSGARQLLYGKSGMIAFTNDGGRSYVNLSGEYFDSPHSASFSTSQTGFAVSPDGLAATTDGGATWKWSSFLGSTSAMALAGTKGWICSNEGGLWRLSRNGNAVTSQPQNVGSPLEKYWNTVWTNDGTTAWVGGVARWGGDTEGLYKTTDGGITWRALALPPRPEIHGDEHHVSQVKVMPSGVGWLVSRGRLLATRDGGQTWEFSGDHPLGHTVDRVESIDDDTAVTAGFGWDYTSGRSGLTVSTTHDGGASWQHRSVETGSLLDAIAIGGGADPSVRDLKFADASRGWLTTSNGALYGTRDGGVTWSLIEESGGDFSAIEVKGDDVWVFGANGAVLYNGGERGDYTPPETRTSIPTDWYSTDATIFLVPVDKYGAGETWWAIGEEPAVSAASGGVAASDVNANLVLSYRRYTGPIRITRQGRTYLTVWSRDSHGNVERPKRLTVKVDKTGPSVTAKVTSAKRGRVAVSVKAVDPHSGVRYIRWKWDNGKVHTSRSTKVPTVIRKRGKHTLTYWAWDKARHRSVVRKLRVTVK